MKTKCIFTQYSSCGALGTIYLIAIFTILHIPLQAQPLGVDSSFEELFHHAQDLIKGDVRGIDLLEEKFHQASPVERWDMAEAYIQLHAEMDTLRSYGGPGNPLWRIFPEEEIAGYVASYMAAMISEEYHEEFSQERRDTMKVHELLRAMGSLRGYALPYLKEMSWQSDGGIYSLGLIAVHEEEAREMLLEIYHTPDATLQRRCNVLEALAHAFNEADAEEVRKFLREAWHAILQDTTLSLRESLSVRPSLLYSMRIAKDRTMLPLLRRLKEALPEVHADARAKANPRAISEGSPDLSHLAYRYEESLLETIAYLEAQRPEQMHKEAQQRRIEDIEKRLGVIDERLNQPDASQIPPLGAFAMRTATLIELELAKRDLPGSREVHEALHRKGQPQDAWPEYAEWPAEKCLEALQGLQEVLVKLHAAAAPEVASHTEAMLEVAASWLEEESKG